MPVSDRERLLALARQLQVVSAAKDWECLAQLDRLAADWASRSPALLPADEDMRVAWQELAVAHAAVHEACKQALHEAGARLRDLQHHNEAHKAYAWQEQFS